MVPPVVLPELTSSARLTLDPEDRLSDDEYFDFCVANPDINFERTAQGEIVIVPPAGLESDERSLDAGGALRQWAKRDGRGKACGSSAQFFLPDGSGLSPDAAWVSKEKLASVPKGELKKFPHVVPEFVIEVMSPSDRLRALQRKMRQWAANGVELGWLIDGDHKRVFVYRGTEDPRIVEGVESIAGEGPVAGFVLPLTDIWEGL